MTISAMLLIIKGCRHLAGFGVELLFFNDRGKLNRAVVEDFDAGSGASNAHCANWRRNFHAAGLRDRASNESECAFRKTH